MTDHAPNTPRTHNAKGQKVDEPVQCLRCLQAWPCEVEVLTRENTALLRINHGLRRTIEEVPGVAFALTVLDDREEDE